MATVAAMTVAQQLLLASTVVAVGGAVYSGYQAKQTADFNEKMAKQESEYQRQLGQAKEDRQRRALKKSMGEQKVAAAGAGVSLMSGSIMDAFTESSKEGMVDAIMIRTGAKAAERGSIIDGINAKNAGDAAVIKAGFQAGSSLLSGASAISVKSDTA